jgi:hypothetical protein
MPLFTKPRSSILNQDKKINKIVNKRDKARVHSGEPQASSKLETDKFDKIVEDFDNLLSELSKISDSIVGFNFARTKKLDSGSSINLITKIRRTLSKIGFGSLTNIQIDLLNGFNGKLIGFKDDFTEELNSAQAGRQGQARIATDQDYLASFLMSLLNQMGSLSRELSLKTNAASTDSTTNIDAEISGINAPSGYTELVGAGFSRIYRLEKGSPDYQNKKYV